MRKQSGRYLRLLVRVPEAYWLVRAYEVKRPGVLILDGRGRRVGAQPLIGSDVLALATGLFRALTAGVAAPSATDPPDTDAGWPPMVTVTFTPAAAGPPCTDTQRTAVRELAAGLGGVRAAEWKDGRLEVTGPKLWLDPGAIVTGARLLGVTLEPDGHRRVTIPVTNVTDTPTTLRDVMRIEREHPAILSASPEVARNEIRVLYRADQADLAAVRAAVTAVGYVLRDE